MKKFKFPLQKVLEYNTHIQKKEKDVLAVMRAEYHELEKRLELLYQDYEQHKQDYLESCTKGTNIINVSCMLSYIKELENKIINLKKLMVEKHLLIDKQTEKLIQVSKDKATVEKLRDSKYEKYKEAERKSEENSIEEFITYVNSAAS